jgi:catechol 2,3-dioxygenase-like lactoylglutathione lyase family enzyme
MTIDHLSFASRDFAATRRFYEGQLGFPVLIHEWMLMQEGAGWITSSSTAAAAALLPLCNGSTCPVYRPIPTPASTAA